MKGMLTWLGKREKKFWILLVLVTVSLWAFMEIADEVSEGDTLELDKTILLMMREENNSSDPIGPHWMEQVGQDITALGGNTVLTLLSVWVMSFLFLTDRRRLALVVLFATGGAVAASFLLKSGFDRPRPDLVMHATTVYTSSFPSSHSMASASAYLTLGALLAQSQPRRRVKALIILTAVFLTVIIGISRVYLGVHWPTDVVAGWAVGSAWALICSYLAHRFAEQNIQPQINN